MFENFYTTKMSPEKKIIEKRFSKIVGKDKKTSRTIIVITSIVLLTVAVSVSVVFASFDKKETKNIDTKTENITVDSNVNDVKTEKADSETKEPKIESVAFTNPIAGNIVVLEKFGDKKHPVTNEITSHNGVDIEAKQGTDVFAVFEGVVEKAEFDASYGNYVVISDKNNNSVLTAHLSRIDVAEGDTVYVGQIIGKTGKTGMATGPHLHVEIKKNGEYIDPESFLVKNTYVLKVESAPLQVLEDYYSHFYESDHEGMKAYCTDSFINQRFRDGTVGGKLRAQLVSATPVMQEDSSAVHFVVSTQNLTEGKTYGIVSEGIYYTLVNTKDGWKIDSWYLKEDFYKIYG